MAKNSIALNFAAVRRNSVLAVGPNIDQRALQASIKTLYKIDAALTHISRTCRAHFNRLFFAGRMRACSRCSLRSSRQELLFNLDNALRCLHESKRLAGRFGDRSIAPSQSEFGQQLEVEIIWRTRPV